MYMQGNNVHPHKTDFILREQVKGDVITIWAIPKGTLSSTDIDTIQWQDKHKVCEFSIGSHMINDPKFSGEDNVNLRRMIGSALISIISDATKSGFRMAQQDMQKALGL